MAKSTNYMTRPLEDYQQSYLQAAHDQPFRHSPDEAREVAKVPTWSLFRWTPGRNGRGHIRRSVSNGAMVYFIAVCAHASESGYCDTPQWRLARKLGVTGQMAALWERELAVKGLVYSSSDLERKKGQFPGRTLHVNLGPPGSGEVWD